MYASQQASPPSRPPTSKRASSRPLGNRSGSPVLPAVIHPDFSDERAPTFTSCLSIPVDGAVPIDRTESIPATAHAANGQGSSSESKRAPRKSKTDALQALQHHAQASNHSQEDLTENMHDDSGVRVSLRDGPPIAVKSKLDMSSVKTPYSSDTPSRPPERPFGLSDCPTFRPTREQFKDPMAYIKSISENARTYGMCKIVPPYGWNMPFVTDTEAFRFKTRLQRLNSIEASSRAKVNFLEQLYRFHKQQGNPRVSVPTINHKPLDLWLLRKEVLKMGGYETVTKGKKWADVGRLLGYGGIPGLSTQLRNSYTRVILPYEHFCERVRNSPNMAYNKPRDPQLKTHVNIQTSGKQNGVSGAVDDSPPSSPLTATSSPLSEPPDESDLKDMNAIKSESKPRRSTRQTSLEHQAPARADIHNSRTAGDHKSELQCEVCQKKDRGEEMLLCDGCDCGFHMFCLDPPLASIPKGQWFCHICLFGTGGDFGFDEGEEHTLSSFQARDLEFRKLWFQSHPPSEGGTHETSEITESSTRKRTDPAVNRFGDIVVTETDVENEFWRLVQSSTETVEVEYGADVHSTTHGSGMPTLETHPLNPYSKDPWNLNNIPILPESLLRFIKSDISGMTVPWTYVGMVFSTFCWHNEDHYTFSINYMHWGETKTWYSIPGSDASKFEAAIRKEAPDLFEAQPDLLFQLVTLMNPKRLKDAGVDVYACNQRAGEFVITFPKAYHAGFNHGFNFNEAVNFALPDWLPFGLECVKRYQEHRKLPVFSHDELLITITQQSESIKTAIWLNKSLQEMTEREMKVRKKARDIGLGESLEQVDRAEDQYQCTICKVFCYLSQVTCKCNTKVVVCMDHVDKLCECSKANKTLRRRFSDSELQEIQAKVSERASIPTQWRQKLGKLLTESARPPLRNLRALLADGDRISYPLTELHSLRKCVNRANEWVDSANNFIVRKPVRKRPRRLRGRGSATESSVGSLMEDVIEKPDRGLEDLYKLLKEVENLGFDCQEILSLKTLARDAEETKAKARALLETITSTRERDVYIQECERLIAHASTLNVHIDEIVEVDKIVMREQLLKELEDDSDDDTLNLADIRDFVLRGRACNLSPENPYMKRMESRLRSGEAWEAKAKELLGKPQRTLEELEDFSKAHEGIPVDPALLDRLSSARSRAVEYEKQAAAWLMPQPGTMKPRVQDVVKMVQRAEKDFNIPVVQDLKKTVEFAVDLETRCENVMKHRYVHPPTEDGDVFKTMAKWREYADKHLPMFTMPNFELFNKQLIAHGRWLESLPWYCRQHRVAHGQPILDDVVESTRPEDDLPPNDEYFTCICTVPVRPPAPGTVSDAVQCDHCFARFHGVCAANGGSCPFCDHQHWNGTLHKERSWHFCYLPTILLHAPDITKGYSEDWKQLEIIVHRMDRLSGVIGQFLSFASQPTNQRPEYIQQVRHYMRKLYKIQFAVSPNPEVSFGLDLAGLHRILAGQPAPIRMKKRRRPKFVFGQDVDKDWADGSRCICRGRTAYLLHYPTVECELCNKLYHGGCVFYPVEQGHPNKFLCPLCCLRKNRVYPYSEVRVKHVDNPESELYVDTKEMLDTFSKDIIYMKLPPPFTQTLFVELIRFTPGQPESVASGNISGAPLPASRGPPSGPSAPPQIPNGPSSHANGSTGPSGPPPPPHSRAIHPIAAHSHVSSHPPLAGPSHMAPSPPTPHAPSPVNHHVPPPPPWSNRSAQPPPPAGGSRWSSAAATAPPPTARSHHSEHGSPMQTPPMQSSRKRKHTDDPGSSNIVTEEIVLSSNSPHLPSPKRRHSNTQTPVMQPARTSQGLSPSLAMMLSPTPVDPRSPPRHPHPPPSHPPQQQPYQSRPVAVIPAGIRMPEEGPSPSMMAHTVPVRPVKAIYNGKEPPPPPSSHRWSSGSSVEGHSYQSSHQSPPRR